MVPTSPSLLERLRQQPDPESWRRLHDLYLPLIQQWLSRMPGLRDEIDDITQEVLTVLVKELPTFQRRREGSFRAWLRMITANRLRSYWRDRQRQPVAGVEEIELLVQNLRDPHSELSREWDQQHDRHVLRQLLEVVRSDFSKSSWSAFERMQLDGASATQIARELGLSPNAVLLAKSRVLKRLREEAAGLVDC
jgi:RNA polymerase sigma-70 factor (ECF subfamily)